MAEPTRFQSLIDDVVAELDQEMATVQHGERGDCRFTLEELARIRRELGMMRQALSPTRYVPQYPWALTDRADHAWPLGLRLMEIAHLYDRLK